MRLPSFLKYKKYAFTYQMDHMDCGPACLKMVTEYFGRKYSLDYFRDHSFMSKNGATLKGLCIAAEGVGLMTTTLRLNYEKLKANQLYPSILFWNQKHYVVLYNIQSKGKKDRITISDPSHGIINLDEDTFLKSWATFPDDKGVMIAMSPGENFYNIPNNDEDVHYNIPLILKYLKPFKKFMLQILTGMILSTLISLLLPFVTQLMVDKGIHARNFNLLGLILCAQLAFFIGSQAIESMRNWTLLHISNRVSITILSDYLSKLMRLPISFFENRNFGDFTQRLNDHGRIEQFLTVSSLSLIFSFINIITFSIVLGIYNVNLLFIFLLGATLSVCWAFFFSNERKKIDYRRFQALRENQNNLLELIYGIQEVKLNNSESTMLREWKKIQVKLFNINFKNLKLEQYQLLGYSVLNQFKNIIITYYSAILVMENRITLGVLLGVSFIIGQLNGPLSQIIDFIKKYQDARLSMERLNEVHCKKNEDDEHYNETVQNGVSKADSLAATNIFGNEGITFLNASFRYGDPSNPLILDNINLHIPHGKITAIVGESGSGKTTLLKILLKIYTVSSGSVMISDQDITKLGSPEWRQKCSVVMQDGHIFTDTIANNISMQGENLDERRLEHAIQTANLTDYINGLPLGVKTKIGSNGTGMSGGQKQRVLIARAIYKNPDYLLFDEATSALDANNESMIMNNLYKFFKGKTVVIIAHRLSTVKNADQIIVLDKGKIIERGTHHDLTQQRNFYFNLVKNQLELSAN
ncbi:peptidase domain-containing ABC transporter [Mucilaginibacter sp. HC2]|uniref:peptidase domain-containing ABC transporter n=1 Tax=Mucilaginibacter inviolabilis TaxID=2714892 RepID=UPI00140885D2|nr:peptidase domain-containing ABC transporter [Mucilaginibacter inviolabilis]NHA05824.1 peptidase domain-containing ABC transporter [Mucilaginibacter inviolabilis]